MGRLSLKVAALAAGLLLAGTLVGVVLLAAFGASSAEATSTNTFY
jgi:hypothetical protein